jgi:hypothetical protein
LKTPTTGLDDADHPDDGVRVRRDWFLARQPIAGASQQPGLTG